MDENIFEGDLHLLSAEELEAALGRWDTLATPGVAKNTEAKANVKLHIITLARLLGQARVALKPFAERGRAEFTTGNYHNPDPAPERQIFGSEVQLSVGRLAPRCLGLCVQRPGERWRG